MIATSANPFATDVYNPRPDDVLDANRRVGANTMFPELMVPTDGGIVRVVDDWISVDNRDRTGTLFGLMIMELDA
jgi:hypothetical protein